MYERFEQIRLTPPMAAPQSRAIGRSREGIPLHAFRFGHGSLRVSLLAGCHADEPVGPRLLRHLIAYLGSLPEDDQMLRDHDWWIIPHINPDGERRNARWTADTDHQYDIALYLKHVVRELPGDDIEFGFPHHVKDSDARPENRAAFDWWSTAEEPFDLHLSLHGIGHAAGPWFLLEEAWKERCTLLRRRCRGAVAALGYVLHDVDRRGEKGFVRLGRGFCTRPNSDSMQRFFLQQGDAATASKFRPSSMETIRGFGGNPLTLVSEMPLFITPGVGDTLGPPDPVAETWKSRIGDWRLRLGNGEALGSIHRAAAEAGLQAMPVVDQMRLQWTLICAGVEQIRSSSDAQRT